MEFIIYSLVGKVYNIGNELFIMDENMLLV